MRKHKNKIIACLFVLVVLATVYWWGGNAPSLRGWNPEKSETVQTSSSTNTKTENEDENLVLIKDLKIDKLLAILIKKIKTQITNIRNEKH